jgi:SH3-like domain-containing protein
MIGRTISALLIAFPLVVTATSAVAQDANPSGLDIPRWVSLRAGEVNLRTGPGARYPVDWVFQRRNLPVEVIGEFENWRQVRDSEGTTGWVHKSMLSGRRTASIAVAKARLMDEPGEDGATAAIVEAGVVVMLESCAPAWCRVAVEDPPIAGWIPRAALWGLYPGEAIAR